MLVQIIEQAILQKASDIHITFGLPPVLRIDGKLVLLDKFSRLDEKNIRNMVKDLVDEDNYKKHNYIDTSFVFNQYRLRVHVFRQKQLDAISMRLIPSIIPSLDELNLPRAVHNFTNLKCGLILITGKTGTGKSTTMASLIDDINTKQRKHIITVEDPIEFVHHHKQSMVNQKEVGTDVNSFADAVKAAMREDPDILLVGEMRDLETIQNTMTMAETGHLVIATLHTKSAAESVDRVIDVFPSSQQHQIRTQFANVIQGIVAQELLPGHGGGRVPLCEVLIANDAIRSLIRDRAHPSSIIDQLQMNHIKNGSQSIYQGLKQLYKTGRIDFDTAIEYAGENESLKNMILERE